MFENLLQLAADEDKVTLKTMAEKYPDLRKNFEMGEKVAPLSARLGKLGKDYDTDLALPIEELERWHSWKTKDWPTWEENNKKVEEALTAAQEKITELENNRSAEVTPEEIKQIVSATLKEAGFVNKTDLEGAMAKFASEKIEPTLNNSINGMTSRFEDVFDKIEDVIQGHRETFGERLRPKAVFDYMKEHKIADPEEAYSKMTATKREEKTKAQIDADKKAEYERGKKEAEVEARKAAAGARSMPVDGQGSSGPPKGALMRRALARQSKDANGNVDIDKIPLGKGVGRAAAAERAQRLADTVS